jgi:hypothetical protein
MVPDHRFLASVCLPLSALAVRNNLLARDSLRHAEARVRRQRDAGGSMSVGMPDRKRNKDTALFR